MSGSCKYAVVGLLGFLGLCGCAIRDPAHRSSSSPLVLVADGRSDYVVVFDHAAETDRFAAEELADVLRKSLGIAFPVLDANGAEARRASHRILIGRSALTEAALGAALLDSLRDQESLVTRRGADLVLVGGGPWGTLYAVYDFLENEAGYRNFGPYPGGERFVKSDTLVFSGRETRRIPAFTGFRDEHTGYHHPDRKAFSRFYVRNRGNRNLGRGGPHAHAKLPELESPFVLRTRGHGLFMFVPPHDLVNPDGTIRQKGWFERHPEYFSMLSDGTRTDRLQLCLSNPDLRRILTEAVVERIRTSGDGVYMVGCNDRPGKFCHCPECQALEARYGCGGGPLFDYILELCEHIKEPFPDVYITTLAYRKGQSEVPPKGVVFPENFIIDFAPVDDNWTVSLRDQPHGTYANLLEWERITHHVSYWYYTTLRAPYALYERTAADLRAMRDAGVRSVGLCGMSSPDLDSLVSYVFFRLLIDPDQDVHALVREFCEHEYGAAAPLMVDYLDGIEGMRRDATAFLRCDESYRQVPVRPEMLSRWQRLFDDMAAGVADDPLRARNVRMARLGLDLLTLVNFRSFKAEVPDAPVVYSNVLARAQSAYAELQAAGRRGSKTTERYLDNLALAANLRDDSLPPPLDRYPRHRVIRQLPNAGNIVDDGEAIAGKAAMTRAPAGSFASGAYICFYDRDDASTVGRTGVLPKDRIVPDRYQLHRLGRGPLSRNYRLVLSRDWHVWFDLGAHFPWTFPDTEFEFWASLKFSGPDFDPNSPDDENTIRCDQVFLVAFPRNDAP